MVRCVALIALAGCGRIGFDAAGGELGLADSATDAVPLGHDEDGDGVPDGSDACPHLVGSQTDSDGDGVGDDCDPDPAIGGDRIALFATMGPGDQPFTTTGGDGVFTQLPDALLFDGALGGDNNLFGTIQMPIAVGSVRVALGLEILAVVPGSTTGQNQIAMSAATTLPEYFVELNQVPGVYDNAEVVYYDGTTYAQVNPANLANGIHPGSLFFQSTQRVGQGIRFDVSWPGEPYTAEVMDALYQGATLLDMNFNNVHFEIRWLVLITSP